MDSNYDYDSVYSGGVSYSTSGNMDPGMFMAVMALYLVIIVFMVVAEWKLFTKAGKPGWAALIPFYNIITLLEIIGRPMWWLLLMFVPLLNIWVTIVVGLDLAKSFGKSTGMGVLVALLPIVGIPMLAFSKSTTYVGPVAQGFDSLAPAPDRAPAAAPVAPTPPQQ